MTDKELTARIAELSEAKEFDLSSFDTSRVTDMHAMFKGCDKLTSLDLSPLDTSKVTDMGGMFSECSKLASLDLSPLDTSKVTNMSRMFCGETIRFSDFEHNRDITMLEYEVPDTVWIKEKPKKNPKEGKHYTLRHKYRGVIVEEGSYYKSTKEVTPAIELVGVQFIVTGVDQIGESGYYTRPSFNVHLSNPTTGERIMWYIRPGASSINDEYVVHLVGLNDRIGLKGKTIYSATQGGYGDAKYTNVSKYVCTGTDAVIDCTS